MLTTLRAQLRLPSPSVLRVELLAGLVVALALIPEAISFSIIAGVDPRVGLYASFTMAVAIAICGGRPAMISAATGAMALVVVSLVEEHGVEYLLAATILAGAFQIALAALGAARLMRFVPRSVMTGFVTGSRSSSSSPSCPISPTRARPCGRWSPSAWRSSTSCRA